MTLRFGALCPLLLVLCLIPAVSHAGWIENGMPLTQQFSAIGGGAIASDGHAGAIVVFEVCRNAVSHIVAQRTDSLGNPLWGGTGVDVCQGTGNEERPYIVSDGAGGAIVIWQDYRVDAWTFDLYAQRVSASGTVQWAPDGVPICTATERQYIYGAIPDGAGGAIFVWQDYRILSMDIYAQRVDAAGTVQWTADGVAVCAATGWQTQPSIDSDGAGGAIVAWQDERAGQSYYGYADIYAQRVNAAGAVQWTADGVPVCAAAGSQYYPEIVADGAGGMFVAWMDDRSDSYFDIYSQRVNASGDIQWAADGVPLCAVAQYQHSPKIIRDGAGGAIVTWWDARDGYTDIYSQRVNASGTVQWTTDGVPICSAPEGQAFHAAVSDGAGGAIIIWEDGRNWNKDVYAQRIDASGVAQWLANGILLCSAAEDQTSPRIVADGYGGAIAVWEDSRNGNKDMYAQRVGFSGNFEWNSDGVSLCSTTGGQQLPQIAADGFGGAIITWSEYRGGNLDIYAQRLDDFGRTKWTVNGVAVCTSAGIQENQQITTDGAGGAIIVWQDARGGSYRVYAQRVNAAGEVEWATDGVAVCLVPGEQMSPRVVSDGAGGAIIVWHDARNAGLQFVCAQRVNAAGIVQWAADGVPLCGATYVYEDMAIASDGAGGAIVAWGDYHLTGNHIFAQRVNASGVVQWAADGVQLCASTNDQHLPEIASDGAGGAVVTWSDETSGVGDVYAQKVNASGAVQWTADGVAVCALSGSQGWPKIASDGAGGAIIIWAEGRSGSRWEVYGQRVNASGTFEWATDGILIYSPMGSPFPQLVSDGAGGAIAMWPDYNGAYRGVRAQRISVSGTLPWGADGIALSSADEGQDLQIAPDGAGGGIVTWVDNRCGAQIYAHRISASGDFVATTLQSWSASLEETAIRVNWTVSSIDDGVRFVISRASAPGWSWVELNDAVVSRDGLSLSFTDARCVSGSTYKYRVEYEADDVTRRVLFETEAVAIPDLPVTLYQNHPNPFNPRTVVRFYLPEAQEILLDVYDVAGRRVARLAEGMREKGYHEVTWDGRNNSGETCSSGVYFTRLEAGKSSISRKMVIMR